MVGLTLGTTGVSVLFNFLGRDFFNALAEKDAARFSVMLMRWAAALAVGVHDPGAPQAGGCLGGPRARAWAAAALVFIVALALLYVVLFVGGDHQPSYWAVLLLRILAFVLPLYLVVQTCAAFVRHRRERAAVVAGVGVGRV